MISLLLFTPSGSRILQLYLDAADLDSRVGFLKQLRSQIWEMSGTPYTNHVLQKCIRSMPPQRIGFMAGEMQGRAVEAAQHRVRSRILQRLVELCPTDQTAELVDEVIDSAAVLCKHPFGNYIIQAILEHGTSE